MKDFFKKFKNLKKPEEKEIETVYAPRDTLLDDLVCKDGEFFYKGRRITDLREKHLFNVAGRYTDPKTKEEKIFIGTSSQNNNGFGLFYYSPHDSQVGSGVFKLLLEDFSVYDFLPFVYNQERNKNQKHIGLVLLCQRRGENPSVRALYNPNGVPYTPVDWNLVSTGPGRLTSIFFNENNELQNRDDKDNRMFLDVMNQDKRGYPVKGLVDIYDKFEKSENLGINIPETIKAQKHFERERLI